jgi:hypothetical protein
MSEEKARTENKVTVVLHFVLLTNSTTNAVGAALRV